MRTLTTSRTVLAALLLAVSPARAAVSDPAARAAALAVIDPAAIRADLAFIASDTLLGRDTPSTGQRVAARYIRARLERAGFAPGAGDSFLHTYPLLQRGLDEQGSRLSVVGEEGFALRFGRDYFLPFTRDLVALELQAPVVWCGRAASDDLPASVAGAWALCEDSDDVSWIRRRRYLTEAGAIGMLVIPRLGKDDDPFPERFVKVVEFARLGAVRPPPADGAEEDEPEGEAPFPQVYLARSAGERVLAAARTAGERDAAWLPALGDALGIEIAERRVTKGPVEVENVCGLWPGRDPALSDEVIVVSAHYDHVGARGGEIWNGADDNGSGTCGLLALADALATYGPMRRSVLLLWVSGEEKGLFGSDAWTRAPTLRPGARAICDLNVDMIGRNAPDVLLVTPTRARPEYGTLTRLAEELAPLEGFPNLGSGDEFWARSDHMNFSRNMGLPVAFFFSGTHEDYHKPTDTFEKVDYDKVARVTRLVLRMLDALQDDDPRL
jgi:hypothetical protein